MCIYRIYVLEESYLGCRETSRTLVQFSVLCVLCTCNPKTQLCSYSLSVRDIGMEGSPHEYKSIAPTSLSTAAFVIKLFNKNHFHPIIDYRYVGCAHTLSTQLFEYFMLTSEYLIQCRPYNCTSIAPTCLKRAILVVEKQAELDRGFRYYVCCAHAIPKLNFVHTHSLCVIFVWKVAHMNTNLSHLQACAQLHWLWSYSPKTGFTP